MYSKKEILIAVVISLVILVLCVGALIAAIMVLSAPPTPTPEPLPPVSIPASTQDLVSTMAATLGSNGSGAVPVSQFDANIQYVLDTSAIPCLIVLLLVLAGIVGMEFYNRRKGS